MRLEEFEPVAKWGKWMQTEGLETEHRNSHSLALKVTFSPNVLKKVRQGFLGTESRNSNGGCIEILVSRWKTSNWSSPSLSKCYTKNYYLLRKWYLWYYLLYQWTIHILPTMTLMIWPDSFRILNMHLISPLTSSELHAHNPHILTWFDRIHHPLNCHS